MRTDLKASALLYFLGDDVMEGTQSGLTQEGDQRSPAGADSRQILDVIRELLVELRGCQPELPNWIDILKR